MQDYELTDEETIAVLTGVKVEDVKIDRDEEDTEEE